MSADTIDATVEEPTQALVVHKEQPVAEAIRPHTAQELRVTEVSEALLPAYQKASTLEMTDAEIEALQVPFDDMCVEVRPHDGLIYIPHILISDRLNKVFKPGRWALMCRRHWLEGSTMYGEYVLLIRGVFVGESIGGHPYQPNNPKTNYSDTLESTAAEALRRIAGKRLSCGSQVWQPEYARQWVAKYAYKHTDGKWYKRTAAKEAPKPVTQAKPISPPQTAPTTAAAVHEKPQAASTPSDSHSGQVRGATDKTRAWLLGLLGAGPGGEHRELVTEFLTQAGILMPNEEPEDLPLRWVATSKADAAKLSEAVDTFASTGEAQMPYKPTGTELPKVQKPVEVPRDKEPLPDQDAWRAFPMPFGKQAGTALEELDKKYLFGLWANYTVETEYNGKPKKAETIAKDTVFRQMLDLAGEHYKFEKK